MNGKKPNIKQLFYITHVNNLRSILEHGILSHRLVEERGVQFTPVYDTSIVSSRKARKTPNGHSLWDYANLYFQARNPMLYRVIHEKSESDIAVLSVRPPSFVAKDYFVSVGNAASYDSEILPLEEGLKQIATIWKVIQGEWWNSMDGSKRRMMAEYLVPNQISPELIDTIYVASHSVAEQVKDIGLHKRIDIVPEPTMFFRPARRFAVTDHLSLADGDMFFSKMQTLTISVNTVGIMGKGLASRAKYQFPDVYVKYQDACRQKLLQMGKPYLYKREASFDEDLADNSGGISLANAKKWFLLFATKHHWRENSDIKGIETGLKWIQGMYKAVGIRSLALPALGCGLGNLDWREVGPLMCRYLSKLEIEVVIYLPRETEIPKELLTPEFLLG